MGQEKHQKRLDGQRDSDQEKEGSLPSRPLCEEQAERHAERRRCRKGGHDDPHGRPPAFGRDEIAHDGKDRGVRHPPERAAEAPRQEQCGDGFRCRAAVGSDDETRVCHHQDPAPVEAVDKRSNKQPDYSRHHCVGGDEQAELRGRY